MIYNHYASKLSELDMQIIEHVPPGGNWKNIPESVPSKRLEQIRESYKEGKGSRSTYYGRLRPEMPSYTINTYFNRPGNGCHIHYEQPRTLSQREAARLQTFPDNFEFIGSKTAINNQIGNAVPPLLGYQIAKQFPFPGKFVDLFCGAGGLALGFIWAGWTPIIANDIDKNAIETYRRNIGNHTICGDINDNEIFSSIVKTVKYEKELEKGPIFVLGGPPCQGFSTANTRRGKDDLRNWLFKSYTNLLKEIEPTGFIFENVKGITNLDKGAFFKMIQKDMLSCVEAIKVNKLNSAEFAIPQRRERVIIVGGSAELVSKFELNPITSIPSNSNLNLYPSAYGVKKALDDLPPIAHAEDGSNLDYRHRPKNIFQKYVRGEVIAEDYLKTFKQ